MKAYYVCYRLYKNGEEKGIGFLAKNKIDAYQKAVYQLIPEKEDQMPYSAWVESVTYNNGNYKRFNTCEGLPY